MKKSFRFVILDDKNTKFEWISVGYLSSWIKQIKEIEVHVDCYFLGQIDEAAKTSVSGEPFAIGLPVVTQNFYTVMEFAKKYKQLGGAGKIILGNLVSSEYKDFIFENFKDIDIISFGESEHTLYEVCERLLNQESLENCDGIWYKDENGNLKKNNLRHLEENLDIFHFPDRYFFKETTIYNIIGSRGCMGNCTFCDANVISKHNIGRRVRLRSMDNILDEVESLANQNKYAAFTFQDQTFCNESDNYNRLDELREGLVARNLNIQFRIQVRAEQITDNFIKKVSRLVDFGLIEFFVGFEAFNSSDLKLYGKIAQIETVNNAARILNKYKVNIGESGIYFNFGFINFNPYSSFETLRENIRFIKKHNFLIILPVLCERLMLSGSSSITKKIKRDGLYIHDVNLPVTDVYGYKYLDPRIDKVYEYLMQTIRYLSTISGKTIKNIVANFKMLYHNFQDLEDFKIIQNNVQFKSDISIDIFNTVLDLTEYDLDDKILREKIAKYEKDLSAIYKIDEKINTRLAKELYKRKMLAF